MVIKIIGRVLLLIIIFALGLTSALQAVTAVYDFSPARPFSGDSIYNPYLGIDSTHWRKANFHAHQRLMYGAMDFEYTEDEFITEYRAKNYDIIGLADHQYINPRSHTPAYEHGMGLNNYHLLMLGAESISWFDYPIMLNPAHQMQYQLDKFKKQVKVLGMNHASRLRHASVEVYDNLMGYDLMEMNPDVDPEAWDRALSCGIASMLVANDDAHCIDDRSRWFQACYSMVNTPTTEVDDVFASLKKGATYGVAILAEKNLSGDPHGGLPTVKDINLVKDTINIVYSITPDSVRFIGQEGVVKFSTDKPDSCYSYVFLNTDTYIRAEAFFEGGTKLWTNPFYRTGGVERQAHTVNTLQTVLHSLAWGVLTLFFLWLFVWVIRKGGGGSSRSRRSTVYKF